METEKQQQNRIVIQALILQTCFDVKYHLKKTPYLYFCMQHLVLFKI